MEAKASKENKRPAIRLIVANTALFTAAAVAYALIRGNDGDARLIALFAEGLALISTAIAIFEIHASNRALHAVRRIMRSRERSLELYDIMSRVSADIMLELDLVNSRVTANRNLEVKLGRQVSYEEAYKLAAGGDALCDCPLSLCGLEGRREAAIRAYDGREVWFAMYVVPFPDEQGGIARIVLRLTDIDELKREKRDLVRLSETDEMTGVLNRRGAMCAIALAEHDRRLGKKAVLMVDIDGLKSINDTLGHCEGDCAIKAVASALKESVRRSDIVARMGGDEFMVMLTGLHGEADVVGVAKNIEAMLERIRIGGQERRQISASIGASTLRDTLDYEEMVREADGALYDVKRAGKRGYRIFGGNNGGEEAAIDPAE